MTSATDPTQTFDPAIDPRTWPTETIDPEVIFGNRNPVILEIGSGKGRFLVTEGRAHPELNFLGVEKSLHYHRVIVERLKKWDLRNVRSVNFDAWLVVARMLPAKSIREVHIYFPDPWPRKREQKRRIIRPEVVQALERVLEDDGIGYFVTDHADYFEAAAPVIAEVFATEVIGPEVQREPRTNYEAKYRLAGRPIHEARFRRRKR